MHENIFVERKIKLLCQLGHLTVRETNQYLRDFSNENILYCTKKGRPYRIAKALYGKNETQIDNWAHNIIVGDITLDEKLKRGELN